MAASPFLPTKCPGEKGLGDSGAFICQEELSQRSNERVAIEDEIILDIFDLIPILDADYKGDGYNGI